MVSREEVEMFLKKKVLVVHTDSGVDSTNTGYILKVSDDALLLNRFGKRILIALNSVKKIKER